MITKSDFKIDRIKLKCLKCSSILEKSKKSLRNCKFACNKCAREYQSKIMTKTYIMSDFKNLNKEYIYDFKEDKEYKINDRIDIKCLKHDSFSLKLGNLLSGAKCPDCNKETKSLRMTNNNEHFITESDKIHNFKYDYSKSIYINSQEKINIICKIHGEFSQKANNHTNGIGCPKCSKKLIQSKPELEIIEFIKSLGITNIIENNRSVLNGKELDIYLPDYNLAIEYNGLIWHSKGSTFPNNKDTFDKKSHFNKTLLCNERGINLLHIFENEWLDLNKKEKWKSIIKNKLYKNKIKLYAKKTFFQEITSKQANKFCHENHLQGKGISKLNFGLFYMTELVSVMTFSKVRFIKDENMKYEMIRFCNKKNYSVVGGASKLLKNFRKLNSGGIVSYANRRWSNGHLYRTLGFKLKHISGMNYFYFNKEDQKNNILWSRNKYQKHKLTKLPIFDINKTETENMYINEYRQIFDSGNYVFILN